MQKMAGMLLWHACYCVGVQSVSAPRMLQMARVLLSQEEVK